jgi:TonB family protein
MSFSSNSPSGARILRMRLPLSLTVHFAAVVVCLCARVANAQGQGANRTAPETGVVLAKLSPPAYPPFARQARITGDVRIRIGIRPDGSVVSEEVVSGHPMLKQAALDSAQKSIFECRGCSDATTEYSLTYTFGFQDDGGCEGVVEVSRVRSPKCLYLWRCGRRIRRWPVPESRTPLLTQSQGHITILVSSVCVQTLASSK